MKVVVLFGGRGEEYAISLRSAAAVLAAFPKAHTAIPVGITRGGAFFRYDGPIEAIAADTWQEEATLPLTLSLDGRGFLAEGVPLEADCVFPLLHGAYGEGGAIQGLLTVAGMRYIGCRLPAAAAGMDKVAAKVFAASLGIPVARYRVIRREELLSPDSLARSLEGALGYPLFLKPADGGSSVGACRVESAAALSDALREAFLHTDRVLAEEWIEGAEVEYAVLERDGRLFGSAVGEVEPGDSFYDYDAKYRKKTSRIFIPARVSSRSLIALRHAACRLFRALGCRGLSRVDFFVRPSGEVVFNEINTMPGFTDISMFPMLMQSNGLSLGELIGVLIENAGM